MSDNFPKPPGGGDDTRAPIRRAVAFALIAFAAIGLFVEEARVAAGVAASLYIVAILAGTRGRGALRGTKADAAGPLQAEQVLLAVLDSMPEPAFLADSRLSFRVANEPARQSFGALAEGDPIALRFRAPDVLAAADAALTSGERREADYVERMPENRSWALDILPVRIETAGRPAFLLFRFRDRTAERRIERMRIDFVANASHELRTPLASLVGFIETLQGPARDDRVAQARFLQIMREQAGRMSRLIDDLLSLSRIETKRRLSPEDRADLVEIIGAVGAEMDSLAQEVGVELELDLAGLERLEIMGDRDELTRVFANLVENACRYAADGKRVIVGLRPEQGGVEAYVQDFGPGIDAGHIPRLTERFYRAGTEMFPGGTGLGLSIVRNILLRHGTRLAIRSVPGEGSVFSMRLRPSTRILEKNEKSVV